MRDDTQFRAGAENLVRLDAQALGSPWQHLLRMAGGPGRLLTGYTIALALLVWLDHMVIAPDVGHELVCLEAGVVLAALWFSDRRYWPLFLLLQLLAEVAAGLLVSELAWYALLAGALAHSVGGIAGAVFARVHLGYRTHVRVALLARFMLAAAVAALAGGVFNLAEAVLAQATAPATHWLLRAVLADWLGSLLIVPVLMAWTIPRRAAYPLLTRARKVELIALTFLLTLLVTQVYGSPSLLPSGVRLPPALIVAMVVYVIVRFAPRWATVLVVYSALLTCSLAVRDPSSPMSDDNFGPAIWLQVTVCVFVAVAILLIAYLASMRLSHVALADAESRYRSFIALSCESVWRVEVQPPMPPRLPRDEQLEWLRRHARVSETSSSYERVSGGDLSPLWRAERPWVKAFEAQLTDLQPSRLRIDGARFSVGTGREKRAFVASFLGIARDEHIFRIWGVARDISDLVLLNARLRRDQRRMRWLAQKAASAQEQARRSTAIDLHDGIGQEIVGITLTLKGMESSLPADQAQLLGALRGRLDLLQTRAREMISDLSPPGLYDMGLKAALEWQLEQLRMQFGLEVSMDFDADEALIDVDLRISLFRIVRELLRNVARHANTQRAWLSVRGSNLLLTLVVHDDGQGFDWRVRRKVQSGSGFGLAALEERIAAEGGQLTVHTAPGQGSTFSMRFLMPAGRRNTRRRHGLVRDRQSG